MRARVRDEFGEILYWYGLVCAEDERDFRHLRDRHQCGQRIEGHLHQELVDDETVRRRNENRIAVGLGPPGTKLT